VHNPADTVALDRIVNVPPRGIGAKSYAELKQWAASLGLGEFTALQIVRHGAKEVAALRGGTLPQAAYGEPPFTNRQRNAFNHFTAMAERWMQDLQTGRFPSVADLMDRILEDSGYVADLRDGSDEGEERFANLQELRGVAAQYTVGLTDSRPDETILSLFLEEISLVSDADQVDENAGAVTLLTLHTAKGLEFPVVFIVGMEEGILPHARSIESGEEEDMAEERRLAYVGITRAKKRLYLVHAFRRSLWGSVEVQTPSRFFDEIPENLLTGMVDKRQRREDSFRRATAWDDDNSDTTWDRSVKADRAQGRNAYTWTNSTPSTRPGQGKAMPWSPEGGSVARPRSSTGSSASSAGGTRPAQFKRRDSVQHPTFGVGTVIESTVTRTGEEVTVAFPGVGIKKLDAALANLKKL
jgi:DNA helicase-2/ATP-dependent DNA helicase PcrA